MFRPIPVVSVVEEGKTIYAYVKATDAWTRSSSADATEVCNNLKRVLRCRGAEVVQGLCSSRRVEQGWRPLRFKKIRHAKTKDRHGTRFITAITACEFSH